MNVAGFLAAGRGLLAAVPFWYLVAVPSLLFLTNIGEQAYQDAVFVVLFVYALTRGRADWSLPVLAIWAGWLAYLAWWVLTDSLGAGQLFLNPLRTGLLMLLLPWLVGWARYDNFCRALEIGFRVALVVALVASSTFKHWSAAGYRSFFFCSLCWSCRSSFSVLARGGVNRFCS